MRILAAFFTSIIAMTAPVLAVGAELHYTHLHYQPELADKQKTQVLILATPHLAQLEPLASLQPLLDVLNRFSPDLIAVERMPADVIEHWATVLKRRGEPFTSISQQFTGNRLLLGQQMQQRLATEAATARLEATLLLENINKTTAVEHAQRLQLVELMLAGYDFDSAVLQWSYLPESTRRSDATSQWPAAVRDALENALTDRNEIYALAVPLARQNKLNRLMAMDDHWDINIIDTLLRQYGDELNAISQHPETKAIAKHPVRLQAEEKLASARTDPERVVPYYQFINSTAYTAMDVATQWGRYLRMDLPSGVDRARLAQWETRNLNMAARIREASAYYPGGKILVIVGSAHKPFLEQYLSQMLDLKLVELEQL